MVPLWKDKLRLNGKMNGFKRVKPKYLILSLLTLELFQTCMNFVLLLNSTHVVIIFFKIFFLCVQQKKDIHIGLENLR